MRRKLPASIISQVRIRARGLCEYCHTAEQWQCVLFTIDHITPIVKGGSDQLDNLALACAHCNRQKSKHLLANDPQTQTLVPLYHPRLDIWQAHFSWAQNAALLVGLTAIGRATIVALEMNRPHLINIRAADFLIGRHPPLDDSHL